jgi:dynactin complex subunit
VEIRGNKTMTKERIYEIKNISNRRGMFTEGTICDCLDECVDEIERLQAQLAMLRERNADLEMDKAVNPAPETQT